MSKFRVSMTIVETIEAETPSKAISDLCDRVREEVFDGQVGHVTDVSASRITE